MCVSRTRHVRTDCDSVKLRIVSQLEAVREDAFKKYIGEVIEEVRKAGHWDEKQVPSTMINRKGETVSTTAYLGRLLVKFRMSRKRAAGAVFDPALAPAAYDEDLSANSSQLFLLQTAWSGYLRECAAGKRLGEELGVHPGCGVMIGDSIALVQVGRLLATLHMMKKMMMMRAGGSPRAWLQSWARYKQIPEQDRIMHELRTLVDAVKYGGSYDQLNLPSLAAFECITRRIAAIVDAFGAGFQNPDWGAARIYTGYRGPEDIVMQQSKQWASKKGHGEVELHQARTKMRGLRPGVVVEEAGAVADGALPSTAAPKKKGGRKGMSHTAQVPVDRKCHACHAKWRGASGDQRGPSTPPSATSVHVPRQTQVDVSKCHACHAKRR